MSKFNTNYLNQVKNANMDINKNVTKNVENIIKPVSEIKSKVDVGIDNIDIEKLIPYENQPFKLYEEEQLKELAEDIKANGVLSPVIVRIHPTEKGCYQILSGHNRVNACRLAEIKQVPCIIKEVDDSTANLILVNANLNQRQELLPSEKAFAYKMQMESLKGTNQVRTSSEIAENNNESIRTVQKYIRLTFLIPEILSLVDNKSIQMKSGVNLSYLPRKEQETVYKYIVDNKIKLSLEQSENIKKVAKENNINLYHLECIFKKTKKEKQPTNIKLSYKKLEKVMDISLPTEYQDSKRK